MAVADAGGVGLGDVGEVGVRGAAVFGIRGSVDVHVLVEDVEALRGLSGLSLEGSKVGRGGVPVDVPCALRLVMSVL